MNHALVSFGLVIALVAGGRSADAAPPAHPAGVDKSVLVQGWSGEELGRIVGDFARLYKLSTSSFVLGHEGKIQKITFPRDIDPNMFSFLVNYIQYPKGFDLKGRSIACLGVARLTPGFAVPSPLYGQRGLFYVPANDQDFGLVYVKIGTQTYVNSFDANEWKAVADDRMPPEVERLNGAAGADERHAVRREP